MLYCVFVRRFIAEDGSWARAPSKQVEDPAVESETADGN
jgi:hypothetical protein